MLKVTIKGVKVVKRYEKSKKIDYLSVIFFKLKLGIRKNEYIKFDASLTNNDITPLDEMFFEANFRPNF